MVRSSNDDEEEIEDEDAEYEEDGEEEDGEDFGGGDECRADALQKIVEEDRRSGKMRNIS